MVLDAIGYLSPVVWLVCAAMAYLIIGLIADKAPNGKLAHYVPPEYLAPALTMGGAILSGGVLWLTATKGARGLFLDAQGLPLLNVDFFGSFFGFMGVIGTLVVMLMSVEFFIKKHYHRAEFFTLLMLASAAIMMLALSVDFLMIYLSMEFLSIVSYALAAYLKSDRKASEAGLKYLLFGATSSAVMLYGISIIYGLTGATNLTAVTFALQKGVVSTPAAAMAVLLVLAGLGFKVAMVPFHLWAPDVYEGAPTPVTAFLSVSSKAAGLAVLIRVLFAVPGSAVNWFAIIALLSAVSMTLGNLVAIPQRNVKRMLAYSSIAQVGYMLVGVLAAVHGAEMGIPGVAIYMLGYLFMNLGAFAVVVAVSRKTGSDDISAFKGLMHRAPLYAAAMVVFFASLAGIPPTAGFLGKFYIFMSAIKSSLQLNDNVLFTLALIAIANSVISVYYYFNVVRVMFFSSEDAGEPIRPTPALSIALIFTLVITIGIAIFASPVINLAQFTAAMH